VPFFRGTCAHGPDLIHGHWPEACFSQWGGPWDWLRVARYPLDCWLTAHYRPILVTAHNLERGVFRNARYTARCFRHYNGAIRHLMYGECIARLLEQRFLRNDEIQTSNLCDISG
jgi:hypothetical protein